MFRIRRRARRPQALYSLRPFPLCTEFPAEGEELAAYGVRGRYAGVFDDPALYEKIAGTGCFLLVGGCAFGVLLRLAGAACTLPEEAERRLAGLGAEGFLRDIGVPHDIISRLWEKTGGFER